MRVIIIVALIALMFTPVNAQDTPEDSIAAITSYTPCVGDKLIFDYRKFAYDPERTGPPLIVEATIASINAEMNAVKAKITIIPKGKEYLTLNRTLDWLGTPKFIESNFISAATQKEVLRIGNFNIETIKVSSGNKSFWFSLNADGSSRYPELIRAVRGNQVLVNLRQIIRPKKSKK